MYGAIMGMRAADWHDIYPSNLLDASNTFSAFLSNVHN